MQLTQWRQGAARGGCLAAGMRAGPGRGQFVGTESAALAVLAAPRLSALASLEPSVARASETALLTGPSLGLPWRRFFNKSNKSGEGHMMRHVSLFYIESKRKSAKLHSCARRAQPSPVTLTSPLRSAGMPTMPDKQISILGSAYCQPIADLMERWLTRPQTTPNAVQSGVIECGYASSIILLLVAMFESYAVRTRYVQRTKIPAKPSNKLRQELRTALGLMFFLYPQLRHRKALIDTYVLRDAIFHNHLWEIEFSWRGSPGMILHGAAKDPAFGDTKYFSRVNIHKRQTKALGLHIVPTRIDRRDVHKVFKTIWETLLFLESENRFQCYVSTEYVRFRGDLILFSDLLRKLSEAKSGRS